MLKDFLKNKRTSIIVMLIFYGVILSIVLYKILSIHNATLYMPFRIDSLQLGIESVNLGRPAIIDENGSLIGKSDDLGIYIMIPYFAKLLGITDATIAMKYFSIILSILPLVFMPLIYFLLFDSYLIGLVSPLFIFLNFDIYSTLTDTYWMQQWIIIITLPLIWLLYKRKWDKISIIISLFLAILMSYSNLIRSNSSLGLLLLLFAVVIIKHPKQLAKKIFLSCGILLLYISINIIFLNAYSLYNKIDIGSNSSHHLWHSAYIGLGAVENDYGITYSDTVAYERALQENPNVEYMGAEYNEILKKAYFNIISSDLDFLYRNIRYKIHTCYDILKAKFIAEGSGILLIIFALLILKNILILNDKLKLYKILIFSSIPLLLYGIVQGIIVMPYDTYIYGGIAIAQFLKMLLVFYLIECVATWINLHISKKIQM